MTGGSPGGRRGSVIAGAVEWVRRRIYPPDERGDVHYRSPDEIALQNAADALGVTLGEDYLDHPDVPEDLDARAIETDHASRLDASREELIVYIEGIRRKRRLRRRARRRRVALAIVALVLSVAVVFHDVRDEQPQPQPQPPRVGSGTLSRDAWSKISPIARTGSGVSDSTARSASTEMSSGRGRLDLSTFLDVRGHVCTTISNVVRGATVSKGLFGCSPPSVLAAGLSRVPAYYTGLSLGKKYVLLNGYARDDLERVVPKGGERIDVRITGAWSPRRTALSGFSIKAFMIRVRQPQSVDVNTDIRLAADSRPLHLMAMFGSGRASRLISGDEARRKGSRRREEPPS